MHLFAVGRPLIVVTDNPVRDGEVLPNSPPGVFYMVLVLHDFLVSNAGGANRTGPVPSTPTCRPGPVRVKAGHAGTQDR